MEFKLPAKNFPPKLEVTYLKQENTAEFSVSGYEVFFSVWIRNRLGTVHCHTEKSYIATYYRKFSTNLTRKITNFKI